MVSQQSQFDNDNNIFKASSLLSPQNSGSALKSEQTFGFSSELYIAQLLSSKRLMHLTPGGFPRGIPGTGDDIDTAIQQAPQP
jgi:hypothetical protein